MDADQLALVDLVAFIDQQATPLLQADQRIGWRGALTVRDHDAVGALGNRAFRAWAVMIKHMEQQAGAGGDRAEFGLETDQATGRDHVFQARTTASIEFDIGELPAAAAEALHDATLKLLIQVDD